MNKEILNEIAGSHLELSNAEEFETPYEFVKHEIQKKVLDSFHDKVRELEQIAELGFDEQRVEDLKRMIKNLMLETPIIRSNFIVEGHNALAKADLYLAKNEKDPRKSLDHVKAANESMKEGSEFHYRGTVDTETWGNVLMFWHLKSKEVEKKIVLSDELLTLARFQFEKTLELDPTNSRALHSALAAMRLQLQYSKERDDCSYERRRLIRDIEHMHKHLHYLQHKLIEKREDDESSSPWLKIETQLAIIERSFSDRSYSDNLRYLLDLNHRLGAVSGICFDEMKHIDSVRCATLLSASYCQFCLDNGEGAIEMAERALQVDPTNEICLLRRANGYTLAQDYKMAANDYKELFLKNPLIPTLKNNMRRLDELYPFIDEFRRQIKG